jgi:hypothetical protein
MLGNVVRAAVFDSEWSRKLPKDKDAVTSLRVSGGGQVMLSPDVWLSLAVGGELNGGTDEQRGMFVLSSFKWALSRQPSVKAPSL